MYTRFVEIRAYVEEFQEELRRINQEAVELARRAKGIQMLLEEVQALCEHPSADRYRGYSIGECPDCAKVFETSEEIDQTFGR